MEWAGWRSGYLVIWLSGYLGGVVRTERSPGSFERSPGSSDPGSHRTRCMNSAPTTTAANATTIAQAMPAIMRTPMNFQ